MAKTVLVADDSKTIRRVVEMTFEKTGFEVVSTPSARDALERVPSANPAVVIADVAMADGDGYSLCTALKQQATTAHIPVILIAGASEPVDETKAQLAHADGHIKKPFDSGDLIDLVRRVTGEAVEADVPKSFAATLSQRTPDGVLTPRAAPPAPPPASGAHIVPDSIFSAPTADTRPPVTGLSEDIPLVSEDIEVEEDLVIEEVEPAQMPAGPSLEPPTPPSPEEARQPVDMWALAEGGQAPDAVEEIDIEDEPEVLPLEDAVQIEPMDEAPPTAETPAPPPGPGTFSAPSRDVAPVAAAVADAAAPKVAEVVAPATPGLSKEELTAIAREVIEQIAWDVVPDLAEAIIREELARLTAAD